MQTPDTNHQLVVFSLGREEYALPIEQVREIVRYAEPSPVLGAAAPIRGTINLRGKAVSVCDLATRLGLPRATAAPAKIVIVETAAGTAGVIAEDVAEVLTVSGEQLGSTRTGPARTIATIGERTVVVLDANDIFAGLELAAAA